MTYQSSIAFSLIVSFILISCTSNPLNGKWSRNNPSEQLIISNHQYSIVYKISTDSQEILKQGKIIFRNDSIQLVPSKIYDTQEQQWIFDYSKERPVFLVELSNDTLRLINSSDTLIYSRLPIK
jgi:hypothetical protein